MKTLIVFSHTNYAQSKVNKALIEAAGTVANVTIRNLEELYGHNAENIDVETEQKFITECDRIVFQCPVFWFSTPPMLKAYIDRVFTHGWAYGTGGNALKGKVLQLMLSTGAPQDDYKVTTIGEFFLPLTAVGTYTGMEVAPIRVAYGCLNIKDEELSKMCENYKKLLSE